MIYSRKDVDDILNSLDYIKIVPSYYEKTCNYSNDLYAINYLRVSKESKKDDFKSFIVLDTETTGLSPKYKDKMVQVTAIKFVDFKPVEIFTTLLNPKRFIPSSVSKIHGITNEMVEFSPIFEEVKDAFSEFIKGLILVGHNISFDLSFLASEGVNFLDLDVKIVDTLFLSRNLIDKNYIENYKLGTLCKYFCLDYFNYHNATEDVLGTSYVFLNLLNLVFIDEVIDF